MTTDARRRDIVSHAWLPALGAVAGAAAAWLALLSPAFLPSVARFTCRVTSGTGHGVVISAPTLEQTRERALAMVGSSDASVEAARARLRAHAAALRDAPAGPLSQLAPAAECAALLRARADLTRTLAGPLSPSVVADEPEGAPLSNELAEADARLERAALGADPSALRAALLVSEAAEDRWLTAIQPDPRRRFAIWLARELDRGSQFLLAAEDLEALQTPYQRELIQQWMPQLILELESGALGTLASMPSPGTISAARARTWVWTLGLLAGALAGMALGLLMRALLDRVSRARAARTPRAAVAANGATAPAAAGPLLAPAVGGAWLHLVSAEDAPRVARAAGELAVPLIARGDRVLLIEAGQQLRLHESFACAPRWGVGECLSGELPLLGTVQRAGVRDLYLLASGSYAGRGSCDALGRLLDEARRHFGAVVVALDARVPAEFRALAQGRRAEAWWPQPSGRLPRAARAFGERIGIPVTPFGLPPRTENWLEALERRIEAVRELLLPGGFEAPAPPGVEGADRAQPIGAGADRAQPIGAGAVAAAVATGERSRMTRFSAVRPTTSRPALMRAAALESPVDPDGPTVYRPADEDDRNRERLRFLKWMRQVRAERSKRQMTPVS